MSLPARLGVYGGGRMGSGIAGAFLVAGSAVTVIESDEPTVSAARERVERILARALEHDGDIAPGRLLVTSDPAALEGSEAVIEAVPELIALKRQVLREIERCAPGAAICTNTSSLSIDGLAAGLGDPSRFIGLHFFNPVPSSALVEIVIGSATSGELLTTARSWIAGLGKTAITVTDSPGFASSRLGISLALEAMRMLEEGIASAEDIDTAMELGYRHPMGPLRTTDLVGLDVRLAIADHLEHELGERFAPPRVLRDKVAAGEWGRKTGQGFYHWATDADAVSAAGER